MAVDERSRHELYLRLEEAIGTHEADTLMSLLPPVGWADVATKHDLENLRVATKQDIEGVRTAMPHGLGSVRTDLAALEGRTVATGRTETRTLLCAMVSFGTTVASLTYAAARLG